MEPNNLTQEAEAEAMAATGNEADTPVVTNDAGGDNVSIDEGHPVEQDFSTLLPRMELNRPVFFSSCSESETDEALANPIASTSRGNRGERTTSPPPKCAICLERCKNKCFTDTCMHQFCFNCLCEWSKLKADCPLCKHPLRSIIYNITSIDQYEEYHVESPISQSPHNEFDDFPQMDMVEHPDLIDDGRIDHGDSILARDESGDDDGETGSDMSSQSWRRHVYDSELYALPVSDVNGRFTDSSARFYRENPAQLRRIYPWIYRDIVSLITHTHTYVTTVADSIYTDLTMMDILSPGFRQRIIPYLGNNTLHFIHELSNFARSPYDMDGYDSVAHYSAQSNQELVIVISSSDESTDNEIDVADNQSNQRELRSHRNSLTDNNLTIHNRLLSISTRGGDTSAAGAGSTSMSQQEAEDDLNLVIDLRVDTDEQSAASVANLNTSEDAPNPRIDHGDSILARDESGDDDGETGSDMSSQSWRRHVYDSELYALPVSDVNGRFTDSSARFYRENPAQLRRIYPWIYRDIVSLITHTHTYVTTVADSIYTDLTMMDILSPGFRQRIIPYLGNNTLHFIHELSNFARSPYDMDAYDSVAHYSAQSNQELVIVISSSDESTDNEIDVADNQSNQRELRSHRNSLTDNNLTIHNRLLSISTPGGDTSAAGAGSTSMSQQEAEDDLNLVIDLRVDTDEQSAASVANLNTSEDAPNPRIDHGDSILARDESGDDDGETGSDMSSQSWRRHVYDSELYALPVSDVNGRFTDSSARFYRENPAQLRRIYPWIYRDIVSLITHTHTYVTTVADSIYTDLTMMDILSPGFRQRIIPYLGNNTLHFIHELSNFARSPYDMDGYDSVAQYSVQSNQELVIVISSSDESTDNEIDVADNQSNQRELRSHRNSLTDNNLTIHNRLLSISTRGGDTSAAGAGSTSMSQQEAEDDLNLVIDLRVDTDEQSAASVANLNTSEDAPNQSVPQVAEIIEQTSDGSDECEIVLEHKLLHLRTNEIVSLDSASDSDVVFVDESKPLCKVTVSISEGDSEDSVATEKTSSPRSKITTLVEAKTRNQQSGNAMQNESQVSSKLYNVGASTSAALRHSIQRGEGDSTEQPQRRCKRLASERIHPTCSRGAADSSFGSNSSSCNEEFVATSTLQKQNSNSRKREKTQKSKNGRCSNAAKRNPSKQKKQNADESPSDGDDCVFVMAITERLKRQKSKRRNNRPAGTSDEDDDSLGGGN